MTREEAIGCIKQIRFRGYLRGANPFYEQEKEALEMAIQALSQEPTEKPMCDRNICLNNEYNGIGCDECIVNKAEQESNYREKARLSKLESCYLDQGITQC